MPAAGALVTAFRIDLTPGRPIVASRLAEEASRLVRDGENGYRIRRFLCFSLDPPRAFGYGTASRAPDRVLGVPKVFIRSQGFIRR